MKRILYITSVLVTVLLTGCNNTSTTSTATSSVAQLKGFSFASNDSMPGLAKAVFTIEERLDTGLVWNKDSMLYGTKLDKVVPRFVFQATPSAAWLTLPDTVCALTGYDTLDFTKQPIYLSIRSLDRTVTKTYEICPTVHTMDPDLYEWYQICESVYPPDDSEQRVLEKGDAFIMMSSNGFELHAYASVDGADWSDLGQPVGLPAGTKVRQMISDGTTLYYGQGNALYTSTDAINWTAHATSYPIITMLMYWNSECWLLADNGGYELGWWKGADVVLSGLRPDDGFPVSDFATVNFESASERERSMIIGGFAENGRSLNTRWNLEYSRHTPENYGYRMQEYSIDRPQFTSLTGVSVIWYDDQLLLFGGVDDQMSYFGRDILYSTDEGLNWKLVDTTKNQLPEVYQARQKQTAIVRNNTIYLFGGQDKTATYSDVYTGRLNSIDW